MANVVEITRDFLTVDEAKFYMDKAVKRGGKYLDKHFPDWYRLINLDKLHLSDCNDCVCGQLARASSKAIRMIAETFDENIDVTDYEFDYSDLIDAIFSEQKKKIKKNKGVELVVADDAGIYYGFCTPDVVNEEGYTDYKWDGFNYLDGLWNKEISERRNA